jgi:leader peptidase (prepilin peptidase)/N-methyltransferase
MLIYLGIICVIDIEYRVINTSILVLGLPLAFYIGLTRTDFTSSILGGIIGLVTFFVIYLLGFIFTKFMTKMWRTEISGSAVGFGDVLLSGVLGLMSGWPDVSSSLIIGASIAGFVSAISIIYLVVIQKYKPGREIPLAPYLIMGTLFSFFN